MSELIAEADDPARVRDSLRETGLEPNQRRDGFADEDELAFDGRADEPVGAVSAKIKARQSAIDGRASLDDVEQVGEAGYAA